MSNKISTVMETFLLETILKNSAKPIIDWDEVASATSMSAGGARNKLGFIIKEYLQTHPDADKRSDATAPKPQASKPQTPKRKAKAVEEDEAVDTKTESKGTPKTPRSKKAKVEKVAKEEEPDDGATAGAVNGAVKTE